MNNKIFASKDKLRGGFYTPDKIAQFILKWAFNGAGKNINILEPSCGDGVFIKNTKEANYDFKKFKAIEFDEGEYLKAKNIGLNKLDIINEDFHKYCNTTSDKFDIIVGNPPYIRYQYFDKEQQNEAEKIFKKYDLKYSKLSNAWVSFIIGSISLLKENGKIGLVIPAELLQVSYAKILRVFLGEKINKINIISFKKLVFPDIQQEVVLLLLENNNSNEHLIDHIEVNDENDLEKLDINMSPKKDINFKNDKWTYYFLEQKEIDLINKVKQKHNIPKISDYCKIEVGITTGANDFFTIDKDIMKDYNLEKYSELLVSKGFNISGIDFTKNIWKNNLKLCKKSYILNFPKIEEIEDKKVLSYIKLGEDNQINKGYKCRIREQWQIIPSMNISDMFFTRRSHIFPRLIDNSSKSYTTDTMHRINLLKEIDKQSFIASYYNSLSLMFAELSGRSHGGGVLELMPSETGNILIPFNEKNDKLFEYINEELKNKTDIKDIIKKTDEIILKNNYGFTDKEISLLNGIWKKLVSRRLGRKV